MSSREQFTGRISVVLAMAGSAIGIGAIIWALGVACTLSGGVFDFFDHLCSDWLMPFGGLLFPDFINASPIFV